MDKPEDNSKSLDVKQDDEKTSNNKLKSRGAKRKRINSGSSTDVDDVLPDNTFDMEKNLVASAIKNNLDDVSVKKILKKVVTNDHVLALVKLREEEEDSGAEENLRPKLTRSKAKELMKVSPSSVSWNLELTPIKHIPVNITPEVKALIAQELPEDEDDDEYQPSDDDHGVESCSDIDSQPRTPATPKTPKRLSPQVVQDGPFKVPQGVKTPVCRKLDLQEEATIALRTRSKLSLSATPIEHIEESFIPPDDLPMPVVDDLWNEFLNECLNPASNVRNEDDDEADPEYNVAADPDANEEDEESLENSIIKISRKELNDLVTELFDVLPEGPVEPLQDIQNVLEQDKGFELNTLQWEGKQEPISDEEQNNTSATNTAAKIKMETRFSIGKTEIEENNESEQNVFNHIIDVPMLVPISRPVKKAVCAEVQQPTKMVISVEEPQNAVRPPSPNGMSPPAPLKNMVSTETTTVEIEIDGNVQILPEQILILQQQFRQHIQIAASNFLQLYIHPTLWSYAPQYKEYLTSLYDLSLREPNTVADVCNLKPAVDLIRSWENTLSEDTQASKEMIEFLNQEIEKARRRAAINGIYAGDFHDTFKKVVANSPVFLYPYLLPPVSFRAEFAHKRFNYLPSEDKLIVLGLEQFWQYMESNPSLFRTASHGRRRGALAEAARLANTYTLPAGLVSTRALLSHVQVAKKSGEGAIAKYFKDNVIEPVKHKLYPFNPKLTLYEQPELEMPRIWIKYLAKSSKRFKIHLNKNNRKKRCPADPKGIEVEIGKNIVNPNMEKPPLPIDFTKEILCNRLNLLPIQLKPTYIDKVDVPIQNTYQTNVLIASNIYTIVNTSNGAQMVPLQVQTSTVNSTLTPVCTPLATDNTKIDIKIDSNKQSSINNSNVYSIHCKCCRLFRRIVKKQTRITDYFNSNLKRKETCDCINKKYPKITNKLKILINNFKRLSNVVYDDLVNKIEEYKMASRCDTEMAGSSSKDFESAIKFQIKLVERCNIARNNIIKRTLHTAFNKFDVANGDVLELSRRLFHMFDVELVDMYKEFLGFLTAEQAEKIDMFKDYFVRNCMEDLMEKIEEQIPDRQKKCKVFEVLKEIYLDNLLKSCDICYKIMECTQDYPELVKYIYSLFPHRRREILEKRQPVPQTISNENKEDKKQEETLSLCEETNATMDYEADNSDSGEENESNDPKENDKLPSPTENDPPSLPKENDPLPSPKENDPLPSPKENDPPPSLKENNPPPSLKENDPPPSLKEHVPPLSLKENDLLLTPKENNVSPPPKENSSPQRLVITIKNENGDTSEVIITENDVKEDSDSSTMSTLLMSEDELKQEVPEWRRDEDKLILEVLKQCLTPEEIKDKTIFEIIEEKDVINIIADSLTHKSICDVRERILYLLRLLIDNEHNK